MSNIHFIKIFKFENHLTLYVPIMSATRGDGHNRIDSSAN